MLEPAHCQKSDSHTYQCHVNQWDVHVYFHGGKLDASLILQKKDTCIYLTDVRSRDPIVVGSRVCTDVKVLRKDKTDTLVPTFSELISAVAVATPLADGDEDGKEWMVVLRLYQMVNPNASVQLYDFTSSCNRFCPLQ